MTGETVRDLRLVALTFSSGAVDAISVLALGKIFTAFMTGNLVFLGVGVAGAGTPNVLHVCVSLLAFAAGVFLGTRILEASREPSGTWPGYMAAVLGGAAVAQVAFLAVWVAVSGEPSSGTVIALIAVAALAMGMQSSAVLSLRVTGVFTTAATATLMYLMRDEAEAEAERHASSASEHRRLAGVLGALVAGATAGGLLLIHARTYAPVLPLVVTALVVATGSLAPRSRDAEEPGSQGRALSKDDPAVAR